MKIVRFKAAGKTRYGVLDGTHIVEYPGTPYGTFKKARKRYPVKQAVLLAPVAPSKIVAVGLNYRDHAEEMRLPIPEEPQDLPQAAVGALRAGRPDHLPSTVEQGGLEGELGVVIGKRCRHVKEEEARDVIGYTCVNDVTARDLQDERRPADPGEGLRQLLPGGAVHRAGARARRRRVVTWVNGEGRQDSPTKDLIFRVEAYRPRLAS